MVFSVTMHDPITKQRVLETLVYNNMLLLLRNEPTYI